MAYSSETIKAIYLDHFREIYQRSTPELVATIQHKIAPCKDQIAHAFFQAMCTVNYADAFLTQSLIQDSLQPAFSRWIDTLFQYRTATDMDAFIEQQLAIGRVHARINLPPHLFNCGIRVLKQEINRVLRKGDVSLKEYNQTSTLASMLIDLTTSLMNESFFGDMVVEERRSQALQLQMTGNELAVKCEQLRADIYHWYARILTILREEESIDRQHIPACTHTEVGLWILHKAPLFFPKSDDVDKLQRDIETIDSHIQSILDLHQSAHTNQSILDLHQSAHTKAYHQALKTLDHMVNALSHTLSSLAQHSISLDSGRDTLTRLFNRRYLDSILRRETHYCMLHHSAYVIILLDIDHFKAINDNYGHDAGDRVLAQMAELFTQHIRAGDFVFRYGGEEFLILLADMKIEFVSSFAETLLHTIAHHPFNIGLDTPLHCTISMGIASHQGHPDYNHVITSADKALYEAKRNGRNCFVIAPS